MEQSHTQLPVQPETPHIDPITPTPSTPNLPDKPTGTKKSTVVLMVVLLVAAFSGALATTYFLLYKPAPQEQPVVAQALPTPIPFFLDITNPSSDVVAVDGEVLVTGATTADASVVVYTDNDDVIVEPNDSGMFETTIFVGETGGLLSVTAFSVDGEEITHTFNIAEASTSTGSDVLGIVQSATFIAQGKSNQAPGRSNQSQAETAKPTKAPSGNEARGGSQQSLQQDTQVVETFLQTKTAPNKPDKVGPARLKELIATTSSDSGRLKPTKVPGRGAQNATSSGQIKKLLAQTATASAKLKRHALSGIVTAVNADSFTVAHQTQQNRISTVFFNTLTIFKMKGIENPTTANVTVGLRITAAGEPITDGLLATRIHVIPGIAKGVLTKNPITPGTSASPSATPIATTSATPTISTSPTPTLTQSPSPSPSPTPTTEPSPSPTP